MNLTVVGAGHIGGTIGQAWLRAGHSVQFAVSSPDKYTDLVGLGGSVKTLEGVGEPGDAVLLALPGGAARDALAALAPSLAGCVLIDATNNVGGGGPLNASAEAAELAPEAAYYRAFNTLGWENFATPTFAGGERADLFYAGPDGPSRGIVEQLVTDVGLNPVWVGGPEHVETVDALTRLWFALVMGRHMSRHTALRLLTD
jgi:predicted dinucleotide-binding enzyme